MANIDKDIVSGIVDRIQELSKARGTTATRACVEAFGSNSAVTTWKRGAANPSLPVMVALANYFNVSLDYLVLGKTPTASVWEMPDAALHRRISQLTPSQKGLVSAFIDGLTAADEIKEDSNKGEQLSS